MKAAKVSRTKRTSNLRWISIQEQVGIPAPTRRCEYFLLYYEEVDEEIWKQECRDHRVRFEDITTEFKSYPMSAKILKGETK